MVRKFKADSASVDGGSAAARCGPVPARPGGSLIARLGDEPCPNARNHAFQPPVGTPCSHPDAACGGAPAHPGVGESPGGLTDHAAIARASLQKAVKVIAETVSDR